MTNFQPFLANRLGKIPPSSLYRLFGIAASMPDVVSLGVGEPDFPTPAPIAEAGFAGVYKKAVGYTAVRGLIELREEIAAHLDRLYGVCYEPETEILVTVGVSEGFKCVMTALCNPGDEIIVPTPCFTAYTPEILFAEASAVPVVCRAEDNFEVGAAAIREKVSPKTKAVFIGFPNNPTGAVLSRENAIEIAKAAEEMNLLVISDEIYDRLTYGAEHTCFPSLPGMKGRTILMGGFSKAYAMTGWRLGYICAPKELIDAFSTVHQYAVMSAPTISQYAGLAALRIGEPFVEEMRAEYDRRRKFLLSGLNELGLGCAEPKGAFYAFPSISKSGLSSEVFAERLLMEERVAVVPGPAFYEGGEGHIRIAYCKSLEKIEIALERLRKFMKAL